MGRFDSVFYQAFWLSTDFVETPPKMKSHSSNFDIHLSLAVVGPKTFAYPFLLSHPPQIPARRAEVWHLLSLCLYNNLMVSTIVKEAKGLISGQKCILEKMQVEICNTDSLHSLFVFLILRDSNNERD